jgi:WD40 repeat protein
VDKTIRIWDTRVRNRSMAFVAAHTADVNVISWNKKVSHLLASGSDDGIVKVWDLRNFKSYVIPNPYHTRPTQHPATFTRAWPAPRPPTAASLAADPPPPRTSSGTRRP